MRTKGLRSGESQCVETNADKHEPRDKGGQDDSAVLLSVYGAGCMVDLMRYVAVKVSYFAIVTMCSKKEPPSWSVIHGPFDWESSSD